MFMPYVLWGDWRQFEDAEIKTLWGELSPVMMFDQPIDMVNHWHYLYAWPNYRHHRRHRGQAPRLVQPRRLGPTRHRPLRHVAADGVLLPHRRSAHARAGALLRPVCQLDRIDPAARPIDAISWAGFRAIVGDGMGSREERALRSRRDAQGRRTRLDRRLRRGKEPRQPAEDSEGESFEGTVIGPERGGDTSAPRDRTPATDSS